jgi:peroxiredoxin
MGIIFLFLMLTVGFWGCSEQEGANPSVENPGDPAETVRQLKECPQEGCLAPAFILPDLTGKQVNLSDFRGKVVLLNIWATWCGPCKREIPSLDRLYQLRKDREFDILAVSVDKTSTSDVASFVAKYQMSFPVLHDKSGGVSQKYWARAIPSSFLLDREGVIRWKIAGSIEWDDPRILSRIDQLLSE